MCPSLRVCVMGCQLTVGHTLHVFPSDPKRRAEWFRILGVYPRKSRVFICSAHFPHYFILGGRISRYAVPNAPESRQFLRKSLSSYDYNRDKIEIDTSNISEENTSEEKEQKSQDAPENKIEDFEIRKGNNDMIIKGRFIQTENYLMVSYTPPKKWSLQRQVAILDEQCTKQLRQMRAINTENRLLRKEINGYEKLLPKLRYLQKRNRFLYAQLEIYKLREKAAKSLK